MLQGVEGLLLTAIGGYWVMERAEAHKGNLKRVGQLVGGLIVIASLVGTACRVLSMAAAPTDAMTRTGSTCPFGFKSAPSP